LTQFIQKEFGIEGESFKINMFKRVKIKGTVYCTKTIKKIDCKLNNSMVLLNNGTFGEIMNIFEFNSKIFVKLFKKFKMLPNQRYTHIKIIEPTNENYSYCPADSINQKLILMETETKSCISTFNNHLSLN
jgi:hypothetical protein